MATATSAMVLAPLKIRQRLGWRTVVTLTRRDDTPTIPSRADPTLVKALARAFRYQHLLDKGGTPRSAR